MKALFIAKTPSAFLATFPSLFCRWNKLFPPPAPPSPFLLLNATPALETETTNDTSALLMMERRRLWSLLSSPTYHLWTSSVGIHSGPPGVRAFPTGWVNQSSPTKFPWLKRSLKSTKMGDLPPSSAALEPNQPKASSCHTSCIIPSHRVSHSLFLLFCC